MLKMAAAKIATADVPCCPICLEQFNIPRQLPCAHSFCEKCLRSHITTEAAKHEKLTYVKCPVCRNSSSPAVKDSPTGEWATLFPVNTVLQSILQAKSKVDRLCDACKHEDVDAPAEAFCVVCKEVLCGDCLKVHRKLNISKDHTIISMDELDCNPENVMKIAGFTCSEHHGEDVKYYCKDHKVAGCGTCFFESHKICSKVIDLKKDLPALLCDSNPEEIIADMKKIEMHLMRFMVINESSINTLESQVYKMTDQIIEVRQQINSILDELEKHVKIEANQIYKEEVIRQQDENHDCLSLMHSVRNSHYLLETVNKYGSNLQKFLMAETMKCQLYFYCNLVREKYEKTNTLAVTVQFSPMIQSILSMSLSELGKVVTTTNSNTLPLTCSQRPTKNCQVERVNAIDVKVPTGKTALFSGVTFLPGDKVMLADYNNNQCILLSSSYQFITSHTVTGKPWNVCVLDDQEVAVSLRNASQIQILSVIGDVISPIGTITTKHKCYGIAAAGKGEMVVNGECGNNKSQWSLINTRRDVKCTHQYDNTYSPLNYIAVNNTKTRVYISVHNRNSLLCFDMDGKKLFTYSPDNHISPYGVAVDNYDNIYVVGHTSKNIHQLSPDGSVIQIVNTGEISQRAICIHKSKDILIITNGSDEGTKLHIYQLK